MKDFINLRLKTDTIILINFANFLETRNMSIFHTFKNTEVIA